jgi:hypothetical protein
MRNFCGVWQATIRSKGICIPVSKKFNIQLTSRYVPLVFLLEILAGLDGRFAAGILLDLDSIQTLVFFAIFLLRHPLPVSFTDMWRDAIPPARPVSC